jgi:ferredoxin-NADP reductase
MMRETRLLMGMPVTIEITDNAPASILEQGFAEFMAVDERFSLWKPGSEICALNRGEIAMRDVSNEMRTVLTLADRTKRETDGYFDIRQADGSLDPSGIVKGWAIRYVASMIANAGVRNFFVDAGDDRRPFTIASAPSESEVRLGVKFYRGSSAFKRSLSAMKPGDVIYGSHLAGSFTLPTDAERKLAFIAGGIGITPFRSMVSEMVARSDRRSVVMLYGVNKPDEVAYADLLSRAERELGFRTVYAFAKGDVRASNVHRGFIDADLIQREIPDYSERLFYVSGPRVMVLRFRRVLKDLGISHSRIKVDFFPGFA